MSSADSRENVNRRARGVGNRKPRNGEAKADCSRLAVNPWRKRGRARILTGPINLGEARAETAQSGRADYLHTPPPGAVMRKPGNP